MMTPRPRSPRKAKGQGGERREEILACALKLIGERGLHGVSTRQIAAAAGISQPTLYAYFDSKHAIALELHRRAFDLLTERLGLVRHQAIRTPDDLAAVLRRYIDFGLANPDAYRVAFMVEGLVGDAAPAASGALTAPGKATFSILHALISELDARGLARGGDPDALAQSIWASLHGLVSLLIARPSFPWVERQALIGRHLSQITTAAIEVT